MEHLKLWPVLAALLLASCHAPNKQPEKPAYSSKTSRLPGRDFSHVKFALDLDLGCYMPLTAGIEDTAMVDGKVYGFCSKECKEEFYKDPHANIRAGEARARRSGK